MNSTAPRLGLLLWVVALTLGCCSAELPELESPEPDRRREALACLAKQVEGEPSLRAPLIKAATSLKEPSVEQDPAVRGAAVRTLRFLKAKDSVASICSALSAEPDPLVRQNEIEFLGAFAKDDAEGAPLALVLRHLRDANREVRLSAAREAGAWGDRSPATTSALTRALEDPDLSVRHNARRTLSTLFGSDQGLSAQAWERWLEQKAAREEAAGQSEGPPLPRQPESLEPEPTPEPRVSSPDDYKFPETDPFQRTPEDNSGTEGPPPPAGPEATPDPSPGPPPPSGPERDS